MKTHEVFQGDSPVILGLPHTGTFVPDAIRAKLNPRGQAEFIEEDSDIFAPAAGGWGDKGATIVRLAKAKEQIIRRALLAAWRHVAPKRLSRSVNEE